MPVPDGAGDPGYLAWPRVAIVTPSYNQAQFIEETIRSALLQGYPDLEYIIIDGGSTDGSVEIIRKYEPWLAYWVSEPDAGQSAALNKGFRRAAGDILAWLNSDDVYLPGVLVKRITEFNRAPDAVLLYGDCNFTDENGSLIRTWQARPCSTSTLLLEGNQIPQQSVFMRSGALSGVGGINPALHYIMDYELWVRMSLLGELRYAPGPAANFRHHTVSKSVADGYKFVLETIDWLSAWEQFDDALSEPERAEVFRRLHVKVALEFIFAGQEEQAIRHFRIAFQEDDYPYGDADALAERIADFSGMGSRSMHGSWEWVESLRLVLQQALPKDSGLRLWRRVASRYHMHKFFNGQESGQLEASRSHLLHGIGYDLRWLGNLGVLSLGMQTFLGQRATNAFKAVCRHARPRAFSDSIESLTSRAKN